MNEPEDVRDWVRVLCDTAGRAQQEGTTFWAFHTKGNPLALESHEAIALIESGKGVMAVELVWAEDSTLMQRGDGIIIKTFADIVNLVETRLKPLSQTVRDPNLLAEAPGDPDGTGRPLPQTNVPWHPTKIKPL